MAETSFGNHACAARTWQSIGGLRTRNFEERAPGSYGAAFDKCKKPDAKFVDKEKRMKYSTGTTNLNKKLKMSGFFS